MGIKTASTHDIGTMPVNIVLSPDGQYAVITSMVSSNNLRAFVSVMVWKLESSSLPDRAMIPPTAYIGDCSSGLTGSYMPAQGRRRYHRRGKCSRWDGSLSLERQIAMKADDFPAGLAGRRPWPALRDE